MTPTQLPNQPEHKPAATSVRPFVAFMKTKKARAAVMVSSPFAVVGTFIGAMSATLSGNMPAAVVFGALVVPAASPFLNIGHAIEKAGDLFPNNRFYLRDRGAALGTVALSTIFAAFFGVATQAGIKVEARVNAEQALKATTPELARDTLVPAAQLCGDKTSGYVYTLHEGKKHWVSCQPK